MLTRIDHIGIACFDLDKTVEIYPTTYGFQVFTEDQRGAGRREAMLKINETSRRRRLLPPAAASPTRGDSAVAQVAGQERRGRRTTSPSAPRTSTRDAAAVRDQGRARVLVRRARRLDGLADHVPAPRDCHGVLTELVTVAPQGSRALTSTYSGPVALGRDCPPPSGQSWAGGRGSGTRRGSRTANGGGADSAVWVSDLTPFPGGPVRRTDGARKAEFATRGRMGPRSAGLRTPGRAGGRLRPTTSRGSKPRWTG